MNGYSNFDKLKFPITIFDNFNLDKLTEENAEELFNLVDKNREYLKLTLPWLDQNKSVSNSLDFLKHEISGYSTDSSLTLTVKDGDKIIGMFGFKTIILGLGTIGYWLDQDYTGRGIAVNTVKELLRIGFETYSLDEIVIRCWTENKKSIAIPEKLGFTCIETITNGECLYGKGIDLLIFKLNRSDWTEIGL
jgi:ribosomal-protein-serine acetyltransferase